MRAADVMTTEVITISPDASVLELAKLLSDRGISGVPVVDADNRMLGIVSEGDLLHRAEIGTDRRPERRRSWWLEMVATERDEAAARDYIKAHGRLVRDIMTKDVITVTETTELADVASLLEQKNIKRVPVMRDAKVVGIISRANLVRALAATKGVPAGSNETNDRQLRQKLFAELRDQKWAHIWPEDIIVRDGIVNFWVSDDRPAAEADALRVAAENIPGVRGVQLHFVSVPPIAAF
jgi:CBS domain-containing protein